MANFQEKLYQFMNGRYGADRLSRVLSTAAIVLLVLSLPISLIFGRTLAGGIVSGVLYTASLGLCIWSTARIMSRKIYKRQAENAKWCAFEYKIRCLFRRHNGNKDTDTHVFRDCPKCKATLRLPREKGKHSPRPRRKKRKIRQRLHL